MWSNDRNEVGAIHCSMNFLGLEILSRAGIDPRGPLARMAILSERTPVLSRLVEECGKDPRPFSLHELQAIEEFRNYRLLQYDLLAGEGYCLNAYPAADRA